jgi:hypothetical protein
MKGNEAVRERNGIAMPEGKNSRKLTTKYRSS